MNDYEHKSQMWWRGYNDGLEIDSDIEYGICAAMTAAFEGFLFSSEEEAEEYKAGLLQGAIDAKN